MKDDPEPPTDEETDDELARVRSDWGFPRFAKSFPRHAELDALVLAFTRGDYRAVRDRAPKLAATAEDEAVRRAAEMLRDRLEADPMAKMLLVVTALLLAVLTAWWVTHDGPGVDEKPPPAAPS